MSARIPKNSTPIENDNLEAFAAGYLPYNELRIALYIKRNTTGYAFKDGTRYYWSRELLHKKISQHTKIARSTVSSIIKKMIRDNKLKRNGKCYHFNENVSEWNVSKTLIVKNLDKNDKKPRHKTLKTSTKHVRNFNMRQDSTLRQIIDSAFPKENIKETLKENTKEREFINSEKKKILERLVGTYMDKHQEYFGAPYREWAPPNRDRDIYLMNKLYSDVDRQCLWQGYSEDAEEHVNKIIDLYFRRFPKEAKNTGISALVAKAQSLHQLLLTEGLQKIFAED